MFPQRPPSGGSLERKIGSRVEGGTCVSKAGTFHRRTESRTLASATKTSLSLVAGGVIGWSWPGLFLTLKDNGSLGGRSGPLQAVEEDCCRESRTLYSS